MNRHIGHIFLALILTVSVTDDIWINIFQDEPVRLVAEIEAEKDSESKEELREDRASETKHDIHHGDSFLGFYIGFLQNFSTGFVKHGNSYRPLSKRNNPKLFLLHSQLRLDC